ncbi:MAG: translation elongation factor Ts [Candidatus Omnitrophica bacterium]|nr:translation elongation factor Ts [Candidatus Omnitrophota bacterium]
MAAATSDDIKRLREETSCGVIDCKKALEEAKGDFNKAKEFLRKRGLEMAAKKSDRAVKEGRVETYIHTGNKIGVLVEVNCETDFVARNEDFCRFSREVAMHIAAMAPENVPALLQQLFVREPGKSIQDLLNELVAKIGENIVVSRFMRFKVGE